MGRRPRDADDVGDDDSSNQERVGDERAVASPGDCFRAHHCQRARQPKQLCQSFLEFRGQHVIGVAAKVGVAPTSIGRMRTQASPQPTELGQVRVPNSELGEHRFQVLAVELGMAVGARKRPDVGELDDLKRSEKRQEIRFRSGGMANGVDLRRFGHGGRRHKTKKGRLSHQSIANRL